MIKVGSMIQSEHTHNGRKGNIGIVLRLLPHITGEESKALARVFYPKTRTSGWVNVKDMKVIA